MRQKKKNRGEEDEIVAEEDEERIKKRNDPNALCYDSRETQMPNSVQVYDGSYQFIVICQSFQN